jgi:nitrate reductase NapA
MLRKRDGRHVPISWEEAIDIIADRVMSDPRASPSTAAGQWTIPEGYAAQKLMKGGLGNNHIDPNARLCMASAVTGFNSVYGVDEPAGCFDDLDEPTWSSVGQQPRRDAPRALLAADRPPRAGRARSPSSTSARGAPAPRPADHFLEFKPHTDLAIANGIAHLLARERHLRQRLRRAHCNFRKPRARPRRSRAPP